MIENRSTQRTESFLRDTNAVKGRLPEIPHAKAAKSCVFWKDDRRWKTSETKRWPHELQRLVFFRLLLFNRSVRPSGVIGIAPYLVVGFFYQYQLWIPEKFLTLKITLKKYFLGA